MRPPLATSVTDDIVFVPITIAVCYPRRQQNPIAVVTNRAVISLLDPVVRRELSSDRPWHDLCQPLIQLKQVQRDACLRIIGIVISGSVQKYPLVELIRPVVSRTFIYLCTAQIICDR